MRKQLSVSRSNRKTIAEAEIAAVEDDLSFSDFVAEALREKLDRRDPQATREVIRDAR